MALGHRDLLELAGNGAVEEPDAVAEQDGDEIEADLVKESRRKGLLFFVGVIVQFFLVGYGLFDLKNSATSDNAKIVTIDNAKSLDAHRAVGFLLSDIGAGLILILVLLAWPQRGLLVRWIVLAVLAFVQGILAGAGFNHWVIGMFHPVNALILLGLSGYLAHYAWKVGRSAEKAPAAIVEAG